MLLYNWHSPLCFRVRSLLSIQGCFQLRTAGCLQLQFRYILGSKNGNYRCFEEYQWCNPDPRTSRCSVSMWLWPTSTFFLHLVLLQFQTENDPLSSSLAACLTQLEGGEGHLWYFSFWCPAHLFLSQPATEHKCFCTWNSFQPLQNLTRQGVRQSFLQWVTEKPLLVSIS